MRAKSNINNGEVMKQLTVKEKWLKQVRIELENYTFIPDVQWYNLKKRIRCVKVNKNEYFIKSGDTPDKMAFIIQGIFRIFYLTESGNDNTLVFRNENKFLSAYSSFLEKIKSKYSFQALEDSILMYVTFEDYVELLSEHVCWQVITTKYSQMLFIEKEKRETEFLCDSALTRYNNFIRNFPNLANRIPKHYIA
ncbi:MAG: cyclic nucleotide-binding domain-containing protein [Clostridia bacterium]|jgi:hypothetical protein|nr:cyclic nucleotide-binding domain-containing protein [Clostridia bacterium]